MTTTWSYYDHARSYYGAGKKGDEKVYQFFGIIRKFLLEKPLEKHLLQIQICAFCMCCAAETPLLRVLLLFVAIFPLPFIINDGIFPAIYVWCLLECFHSCH
jgi:hypothetical protein